MEQFLYFCLRITAIFFRLTSQQISDGELLHWKQLVAKCMTEYCSTECNKPDNKKLIWIISKKTAQNLQCSHYSVPGLPTIPEGSWDESERLKCAFCPIFFILHDDKSLSQLLFYNSNRLLNSTMKFHNSKKKISSFAVAQQWISEIDSSIVFKFPIPTCYLFVDMFPSKHIVSFNCLVLSNNIILNKNISGVTDWNIRSNQARIQSTAANWCFHRWPGVLISSCSSYSAEESLTRDLMCLVADF